MRQEDSNTPTHSRNVASDVPAHSDTDLAAGGRGSLTEIIRRRALDLGFAACGITSADDLECGPLLEEWVDAGRHGDMRYLSDRLERRIRPSGLLAGARSVIVVVWPYHAPLVADPLWRQTLRGRVAAYAIGADYHDHVAHKLERLAAELREQTGSDATVHVDGGPLVEKELARRAGLGWYGHNTNLLRPGLGSFFVLGAIVTSEPLTPDPPFVKNHCGTCRACVPACPTKALSDGPTIDARLCISYLTIELRGPIPTPLRGSLGNWVFGCDVCQDVCPWNAQSSPPHPLQSPWLPGWLAMTESEFRENYTGTPLLRPKRRGLARNAAVVLGNTGNPAAISFLAAATRDHDEPLVRAHGAWALGELANFATTTPSGKKPEAASAELPAPLTPSDRKDILLSLQRAARHETVPPVLREIEAAIVRTHAATNEPAAV